MTFLAALSWKEFLLVGLALVVVILLSRRGGS